MKKPLYILLVLLLFLKADGLLLLLKTQQFMIRYEMREWLGSGQVPTEVLRISSSLYRKHRIADDELQLDGKLYDIRSVKAVGDSVELVVVNDTHEENIIRFITGLGKHRDRTTTGREAHQKHIPPFVAVAPRLSASTFLITVSSRHFIPCLFDLPVCSYEVSTPPPDFA